MEMSLNENSNPLSLEDFSVCKKLVTGGKCIPQFSNSPLGRFCQLTPQIQNRPISINGDISEFMRGVFDIA